MCEDVLAAFYTAHFIHFANCNNRLYHQLCLHRLEVIPLTSHYLYPYNSPHAVRDHSPQLGWALDGFPVFGPVGAKGMKTFSYGFC